MTERDAFERRLESAVRGYVEDAPTRIDAARLTDSLATSVPRVRRLVPLPTWRLPSLGLGSLLILLALLAMMGLGLVVSGALRDVRLLRVQPTPGPVLETAPAVIASPAVATPSPSVLPSPSSSTPIGIVLPESFAPDQARYQRAVGATGYGARIVSSRDSATEKVAVEALIGQGIKVLILCAQDGTAAAAVADEARAAGVKVIADDRLILGTAAVDYYVSFDNAAVGAAQAQYLVDRAGASKGNNLYLYAGAASDNNSFLILEGAWEVLQPRIADGTFVVRNSSLAAALRGSPTLTRDQQGRVIGQVTTNWNAGTATYLAESNLMAVPEADKGRVFILAPNDVTALALGSAFTADKAVTTTYVTGQDTDRASVQAIIDGRQGMTVFKDPGGRVHGAVSAAVAFLEGRTPATTTTLTNGAIDVPTTLLPDVTVTRDNVQASLIDSGYYPASDFTGSWPGKL
jgi:putative multiple sugar transport system substrate-binding protein